MVAFFSLTIFLGAALLFLLQPMFARMVLPFLGGSPAVWNTAMVFYQATLLAGYACAHAGISRLGARRQSAWHLPLLLLPALILPVAVPVGWTPPADTSPAGSLLGLMAIAIGLPFLVVSMGSPVLQGWFAATDHPRARDPYFLYAASNAGSLLALLAYPVLIEPNFPLAAQGQAWAWVYGLFAVGTAGCAWMTRRHAPAIMPGPTPAVSRRPGPRKKLRWVVLSFLPSSLLLGVTSHLSTEVAAVPLLWVVPLAIYLVTFILAFAPQSPLPPPLLRRAFPMAIVPLVMLLNLHATEPIAGLALLHLGVFFLAALLCHGQLAAARPPPEELTGFYLWLAAGGALGGIFNGLLAPLVFRTVVEYPLALAAVAVVALWPPDGKLERPAFADFAWPAVAGGLCAAAIQVGPVFGPLDDAARAGIIFGIGAIACYLFSKRAWRFGLGIGALLLAGTVHEGPRGALIHVERSFFGVHRVTLDAAGGFRQLLHGKTLHGRQSLDPARRREPLTYYHPTGPVGQLLTQAMVRPGARIGAVGLGAGSISAYAQPGQAWTYFEIDPAVARLARDERYFTYLADAPAAPRLVLGDARLSLAREPDASFDVLVLDAYSADSVPLHLSTREALALYLRKLAPGGILAFHISNWHLDLEPIFANLARDAGIVCLVRDDTVVAPDLQARGKSPSVWLAMGRTPAELAFLAQDGRWKPARTDGDLAIWTDDYASLLSVFRWW